MRANLIFKFTLVLFTMLITECVTNVVRRSESNVSRTLFGGYRITPKQCKASRKLPLMDLRSEGPTICMFNHECSQRNGKVVGACMDGFLFGACCQISSLDDIGNSLLYNVQNVNYIHQTQLQKQQQNYSSIQNVQEYDNASKEELLLDSNAYQNAAPHVDNSANRPSIAAMQAQSDFYIENANPANASSSSISPQQPSYTFDGDRDAFSTDVPIRLTSPFLDEYSEETQSLLQPIASLHDQLLFPINKEQNEKLNIANGSKFNLTKNSVFKTSTTVAHNKVGEVVNMPDSTLDNKYVLVQTITNDYSTHKPESSTQATQFSSATHSDKTNGFEYMVDQASSEIINPAEYTTVKLTAQNQLNEMMGVAYPMDISLLDEPVVLATEQSSIAVSTVRPPTPYDSLVLAQNYHTFKPHEKLPEEITISSQTTHVKGNTPLLATYSTSMRPFTATKPSYSTKHNYVSSTQAMKIKPTKNSVIVENTDENETLQNPYLNRNHTVFGNAGNSHIPILLSSDVPQIHSGYNDFNQFLLDSQTTLKPKDDISSIAAFTKNYLENTTLKPIAISYVTGPTSVRPSLTSVYDNNKEVPPLFSNDKLEALLQVSSTTAPPTYQTPIYVASATPLSVQRPQETFYNIHRPPGFVKIQSTITPSASTVLITPKPTITTTASIQKDPTKSNDAQITTIHPEIIQTSSIASLSSISQIYNQLLTLRPNDNLPNVKNQTNLLTKTESDEQFDTIVLHPAFTQSTTEAVFSIPADDKPSFPGYFGPTPLYPEFLVPNSDKVHSSIEEEINTSSNDFNNFPPVRNPNLNMSASASSVTTDLELSTPLFVEDILLKNKMNTLVLKIVESLQGNFDALSDMIDNTNPVSTQNKQKVNVTTTIITRNTTRRPITTKAKVSTKSPLTQSTKPPNRRTTTRLSTTRRPQSTTRKTTRRTTRKPSTTTTALLENDIVDEEDDSDVNPGVNEVDPDVSTASGRKIQCGMRPLVKSGRIVGGKGATFGEFPWQVLVRESTWLGLFTKNKCGGVLISNRYVLTAAHCQPGFLASLVAVLGEFDISSNLESKRSITKNVKRVIVHRQYNAATFENDLALLELDTPVQFDAHIVPICMPSDQADFTGRMATVSGWGRLTYDGAVPSILQEVQVPVIENNVCQEMFHTAGHNKKILNSFLCAGYANGQKDSCEGDSGGPLVLQRPDGRYELAGTVSHGIKCAAPYLPGVYIRTTYYKPWLRSITGVK